MVLTILLQKLKRRQGYRFLHFATFLPQEAFCIPRCSHVLPKTKVFWLRMAAQGFVCGFRVRIQGFGSVPWVLELARPRFGGLK